MIVHVPDHVPDRHPREGNETEGSFDSVEVLLLPQKMITMSATSQTKVTDLFLRGQRDDKDRFGSDMASRIPDQPRENDESPGWQHETRSGRRSLFNSPQRRRSLFFGSLTNEIPGPIGQHDNYS